jgi:hypothetical protein
MPHTIMCYAVCLTVSNLDLLEKISAKRRNTWSSRRHSFLTAQINRDIHGGLL